MHYTIDLDKEHGFVRLTFFGTVTRGLADASLEGTYSLLMTNGLKKLLVDITMSELSLTQSELYFITTMIRSKCHLDISIVVLARSDQMRLVSYLELFTYNRCINLKAYLEEEKAVIGLRRDRGMYEPRKSDD
ncbi:MAG TPA: hypothetical protein PKV86_10235 [Syntrophobacteraceae bacterium]|nr:hypothetical protein [Syntrophobacteraceae bacterium]